VLFHVHDGRRRRWKARNHTQVPRCLRTSSQGQLFGVAFGPGYQFPNHAHSTTNCKSIAPIACHYANALVAVCLHRWYCLDSVLVSHQFLRGGIECFSSTALGDSLYSSHVHMIATRRFRTILDILVVVHLHLS